MKTNKYKRKFLSIQSKIDKLKDDILELQQCCPHENLEYENCGFSGDPYTGRDEQYWTRYYCHDCHEIFVTEQNYHHRIKNFPQAKEKDNK